MRRASLLLIGCAALCAPVRATTAADSPFSDRKVIPGGWHVPAKSWIDKTARPSSRNKLVIGGHAITVLVYTPRGVPSKIRAGRMPFIYPAKDEFMFNKMHLVATRIERYSVQGSVFCYLFFGTPYDKFKRDLGGIGATPYVFAYYDDDNDGKFETFESPRGVFIVDRPNRLRLPDWLTRGTP